MLGALIGAGTSLLGGLFGKSSADKANKANAKAAAQANATQLKIAKDNIALQKEFAKSGIQWKVQDAHNAGVHPLYALGAQTHSFSPVSVGSTSPNQVGDTSLAQGLSNAGASIGNAIDSTATADTRFTRKMQQLQITRGELENAKLASEIALQRPNPPFPGSNFVIPGQSGSGVTTVNQERTASAGGSPYLEAGAVNETGFLQTPTGFAPVMSADAKQRLDDDLIGTILWNVRNRLINPISGRVSPPTPAGPGHHWAYTPSGEFVRTMTIKRPPMKIRKW